MVSCMVARVGAHSEVTGLADASSVPTINALSDSFHPFQAITDILTIQEHFPPGESPLGGKKVRIAWVGDANNVLYDLAIAAGKLGYDVAVATPKGYPVDPDMLELARSCADETGAKIEVGHSPEAAVKGADILVTDTWFVFPTPSESSFFLSRSSCLLPARPSFSQYTPLSSSVLEGQLLIKPLE